MLFGWFAAWLAVCGYAVWMARGWSLVAGVSVALISCWQADERAVSPRGGTPGRKAGLKFNDASCQLRQAVSANELAPAVDWAAAAAPGNVARVSEGRGSAGAAEGPAGDPGRHREARIPLKSAPISIFHYALLTDKAQPDVLFSAI